MKRTRLLPLALAGGALFCTTAGQAVADQELLKLLASDGAAYSWFGYSVCANGSSYIVGAPYVSKVYVFDRATGAEVRWLVANDHSSLDLFGFSVAASEDRIIVGATNNDDNGDESGSAYIFNGHTGVQRAKLLPDDGTEDAKFGHGVSICGDRAVVGAFRGQTAIGVETGAAYIFEVSTGQQLVKLQAGDGSHLDYFGRTVSISDDRVLVGADGDDDNGDWSGSAYVFDATTGQQLLKILPADGYAGQYFGVAVALSGGRALIGASGDDTHGDDSGAVYVFDVETGEQLHKLFPSNTGPGDFFGSSVSIEGNTAIAAALYDNLQGTVYSFDVPSGKQTSMLNASDATYNIGFGDAVCLRGDRVIVGAWTQDDLGFVSGAAYVFESPDDPGIPYCFGDPMSGTPCPCGNDNDGSVRASGCDNGVFASGAQLIGTGRASVSDDSLTLIATHLEPNNSGLFFQANNNLSPGVVWGNGLRCAGGGEIRLQARISGAEGAAHTTVSISNKAGIVAGDIKRYQVWYRSLVAPPCGPGSFEFNTTNGYEIVWSP